MPLSLLEPGDVIILNDPFRGGTHLPDITLITPVFLDDSAPSLFGFVANRAHHADVGGMTAGSMPVASEIYQEGIIIPPLKLISRGEINQPLLDLILANVRTPGERLGDLSAQLAANERGGTRFLEIVNRYGLHEVYYYMGELLAYSERMSRRLISDLPDGTYTLIDYLDGDGFADEPVPVQVAISVSGDEAIVDISGSAPQQRGNINAVYAITLSAVYYVFRCLLGLDVPNNSACLGKCSFCRKGDENLCDAFRATGRDEDGGYAEYTKVPEDFAYRIPDLFSDAEAAPLLCAGAIGYRSLRLTGMKDGESIGLAGFGASGHLVLKMAQHLYPRSKVFVFSRTEGEKLFSKELGAYWAGGFEEEPPEKLHCAIDTTPAWGPIAAALRNLEKGGRLIINAIRKEEGDKEALLSLDYTKDLWLEKEIKSVANITRSDVEEFLALAPAIPIRPEVQEFRLEEANEALRELKGRKIRGAKVLRVGSH